MRGKNRNNLVKIFGRRFKDFDEVTDQMMIKTVKLIQNKYKFAFKLGNFAESQGNYITLQNFDYIVKNYTDADDVGTDWWVSDKDKRIQSLWEDFNSVIRTHVDKDYDIDRVDSIVLRNM